jgi:hypothetical protein
MGTGFSGCFYGAGVYCFVLSILGAGVGLGGGVGSLTAMFCVNGNEDCEEVLFRACLLPASDEDLAEMTELRLFEGPEV